MQAEFLNEKTHRADPSKANVDSHTYKIWTYITWTDIVWSSWCKIILTASLKKTKYKQPINKGKICSTKLMLTKCKLEQWWDLYILLVYHIN